MKRYELEDRLILFVVKTREVISLLQADRISPLISDQLLRAVLSSSLNYGEAQSAESRKDFVHKMQIVLKELREAHVCLKVAKATHLIDDEMHINPVIDECNQLISIFVKSIQTSKKGKEP